MPGVSNNIAAFRSYRSDWRSSPIANKGACGGQQTETSGELYEELEKVIIGLDQEQYFQVGS